MITEFRAKNYGCLRDLSLRLTPLHALIGPNDSGKSTILRGLRTIVQLAGPGFSVNNRNEWAPFDPDFGARVGASYETLLGVSSQSSQYDVTWRERAAWNTQLLESAPSDAVAQSHGWRHRTRGHSRSGSARPEKN